MHTAIVDFRISDEELLSLHKLNLDILYCPNCNNLSPAISGHPDMQMTIVDENTIIVQKSMESDFVKRLASLNKLIYKSLNDLNKVYPQDIILNSLVLGDIFVHRLDSTDQNLLDLVKSKKLINVKQGYTKCSTAVVNSNAIITSDEGIIKSLTNQHIDILYVPPGDIDLPGLNYGFIGGTCGLVDEKHMAFFGDLNYYKYGNEVINFLKKHSVTPIYLKKGKLIDRGTLFII